jgi:hypothetical protein
MIRSDANIIKAEMAKATSVYADWLCDVSMGEV